MKPSFRVPRQRVYIAVGTSALVGAALAAAVPSASAAATPAKPSAVTLVNGSAFGLTLQSQVSNADGSVTATWRSADGAHVSYSGSAGARVTVKPATVGHGRTSIQVSVALPAKNPTSAASTYSAAHRSLQADAARLGISAKPAAANGHNSTVRPQYIDSFCTSAGVHSASASGCDNRTLLYSSGGDWYVADDMQAQGYDSAGLGYLGAQVSLPLFPGGNEVVHLNPFGSINTGCQNHSYSVSWYGLSFTSDISVCDGNFNTWGLGTARGGGSWSGGSRNQQQIEPIIEIHSPPSANIGFLSNEFRLILAGN